MRGKLLFPLLHKLLSVTNGACTNAEHFSYNLRYASFSSVSAFDFLFNHFTPGGLIFTGDATLDSSVIRLTNNVRNVSSGRFFYPFPFPSKNSTVPSFSTSFIFSIVPETSTSPGFGLAFVISDSVVAPGELTGGSIPTTPSLPVELLVVEFDTGQNQEFHDRSANHVGINLSNFGSTVTNEAGFYNGSNDEFISIDLRTGKNIQAWIEFDGAGLGINVTIAPVGISRPPKPLISFYNPVIANYVSAADMLVGFSATHTTWIEAQRVLAWSLSDEGAPRQIDTSDLPIFLPESSSSSWSLSTGLIVGIVFISIAVLLTSMSGLYWFKFRKRASKKDEEEVENWEIDYWPRRISYEELARATKRFSDDELLGQGGFGRVFKGIQADNSYIAVKSINRDSKQGLREFMAEISTIGRLQHKNLVPFKGWCKAGQEMLLVYDYMPNGSLYSWIFNESKTLNWHRRLVALIDIAEGLHYLHHGWLQRVLHRDIKSSNILLDSDMCARLGDFGLAKLYKHGQGPTTTRLVGTVGYMAPELVKAGPTMASDIYSFGVVVLEVVCGRKPIEWQSDDELILVDWVRKLHKDDRLIEAQDLRIAGEYKVEDMETVLRLGLACCDVFPEMRPDIKEVLTLLMNLKAPYSLDKVSSDHQRVESFELRNLFTISNLSIISDYGPRT